MEEKIKAFLKEIETFTTEKQQEIEDFRIRLLSRKGQIPALFEEFKKLGGEEKRKYGKSLNELKQKAQAKIDDLRAGASKDGETGERFDLSRPASAGFMGSRHPVNLVKNEIVDIFKRIGFNVSEGPEIEDDWHNFTALNFPEEHPARDMQDTFFVARNPEWALRTHTSSVQVRAMEANKPPIRTISPGRVFRNEAISARSHCIFHQVEGLYIDKSVSFADLKQTLLYFAREFFGKDTRIRLRPSYFPFTEPSAEMDVYWGLENEVDYRMTKGTGWLEVMGCGMVDPNVLENCGIDPNEYSGYAFGMGVERIAMQRYQISDIRYLFENDIRFLEQFHTAL
ncbi:MAG TPA: phenylalanine--tRNA ligase subunit alpha [Cryomorphaceae bacterium]|nr:phenylalanine--tRNA ligase subunit alpha [Owenweeksia sp.]MBF97581.1 phenylalanine--tRNA ligase subunit alpha [Owenweeksia sp.]HAD98020.1 phenylalanine--tRNA ligase subunit alpha [Cryomorphaceae bacterium]HBF19844.1 phenylalanine--tRNA ligase subunit alpha [Cryomorphaceae bacterium]|tara:strand:+ start:8251 stop:9270 length:1020 start_codon:yes stop_codon:yes gene_type:complete